MGRRYKAGDVVWASTYKADGLVRKPFEGTLVNHLFYGPFDVPSDKPNYVVPYLPDGEIDWHNIMAVEDGDLAETEDEARKNYNRRIDRLVEKRKKEIEELVAAKLK